MNRVLFLILAAGLCACPPMNSKPCSEDSECGTNQRCRRGACGPSCLDDSECGDRQICRMGACVARPECATSADCATGFECKADKCQCSNDSACAANQVCTNGACLTRKRCTADADCAGSGQRCEVTQGVCLPVCNLPQQCAPGLDSRLATAIYSCAMGTCTRRCLNDVTCGGQGLICKSGLCGVADCTTKADCPANQYCTSATFGRCLAFTPCTANAQCMANFECKKFGPGQCPPGFDCSQSICQEQPTCLVDGDCLSAPPMPVQNGFCQEGHCQPTTKCTTSAQCSASGRVCIAGLCVPSVCRGHAECGAGKACIDGKCVAAPLAGDVNTLQLLPKTGLIEVGDTLQFKLIAFRLDGSSYPMETAAFSVADPAGMPSTIATITPAGVLTATGAGEVVVKAKVTGANVSEQEARVQIYPAVTAGRRVLVVDHATRQPLSGVKVMGCLVANCTAPAEVVTTDAGVAEFSALGSGPATFTAVSSEVRPGDGLPRLERASVIGTGSADVYLPLRDNPAHGAAGYNGTISFTDVTTTGQYWAGFALSSLSDVASTDPQSLLGEQFNVEIPGVNQSVPVPGALVLYTSPGFGFAQEVKGKSLGLSEAGAFRHAVAFAGRTNADVALSLRSTQLLGYTGVMNYGLQLGVKLEHRARVGDTADVDNDGLCTSMSRCPMGSEDVPDYANFTPLAFTPRREQLRRTEVTLPKLPSTLDTVIVAAVEGSKEAGLLPLGLSSVAAGPPGQDGTRPVPVVVLRSGAPYGGLEISTPGIWALAGNANGNAASARFSRSASLPEKVSLAPFLPVPANPSYAVNSKTFAPGQPEWASVYSTGGDVARVSLVGSQQRHTLYFAVAANQTAIQVPPTPSGPGTDPATQSTVRLEVVVMDLDGALVPDDLFSLAGPNLSSVATVLDGFSRANR